MLGCSMRASALASRSKRASRSGSTDRLGQDLDGDVAVEPLVARAVDLAHAASTDEVQQPVVP